MSGRGIPDEVLAKAEALARHYAQHAEGPDADALQAAFDKAGDGLGLSLATQVAFHTACLAQIVLFNRQNDRRVAQAAVILLLDQMVDAAMSAQAAHMMEQNPHGLPN